MLDSGYQEQLEDGKVLLFVRNGVFQARIYKGARSYLYRSLKTSDVDVARREAVRLFHVVQYKQHEGLPLSSVSMSQVIDEYVRMREADNKKLTTAPRRTAIERGTSDHMLRQIKRVVKFWREYCGSLAIDRVDNNVLRDYIVWRKEYYHVMLEHQRPKNHRLNPTDKTLQWELTLGKSLVKYAHERGYRGKTQLPTYSFTAKQKIVRPAFSRDDFRRVLQAFRAMLNDTKAGSRFYYARRLLQTYVLILSDTGMRVGEANSLRWGDLTAFVDGRGRSNYEIKVRGKTGVRTVIGRTNVYGYFERMRVLNESNLPTDYVFRMKNGKQVITLIDQFQRVLERAGIAKNIDGETYTLYSLRHFYAVRFLRKGVPVWDVARNMGTSVQMIQEYYGKQATPYELATRLGS